MRHFLSPPMGRYIGFVSSGSPISNFIFLYWLKFSISSLDNWSGCFLNRASHAFMIVGWYIFFGLMLIPSSFSGESFGCGLAGGMAMVGWEQNESSFCGDGEISRWGRCTTDKESAGFVSGEAGFGYDDFLLLKLVILFTFLRILAGLWWHILQQAVAVAAD